MNIEAVALMKFLGHSSIHQRFDEYLHAYEIKRRPKIGGSTYNPYIEVKKQGLNIIFLGDNESNEKGILPRSRGSYIFSSLDIYVKKGDGFSPYLGSLPFGLSRELTQVKVRDVLGKPRHVTYDEEWSANVDFYLLQDLVVAIKYTDMQGGAISMVDIRLPDSWARDHGIAPKA